MTCRDCVKNVIGVCLATGMPVDGYGTPCGEAKFPLFRGICITCDHVRECDYDNEKNSCARICRLQEQPLHLPAREGG